MPGQHLMPVVLSLPFPSLPFPSLPFPSNPLPCPALPCPALPCPALPCPPRLSCRDVTHYQGIRFWTEAATFTRMIPSQGTSSSLILKWTTDKAGHKRPSFGQGTTTPTVYTTCMHYITLGMWFLRFIALCPPAPLPQC